MLFLSAAIAPIVKDFGQCSSIGGSRQMAFVLMCPRLNTQPRLICQKDQRKISEELRAKLSFPNELVDSVFNFLDRQIREFAVNRRLIQPMLQHRLVFRSLQQ